MSKEILEALQKDIAGLTSTVQERLVKCESEGKELADKLAGVLKEQTERKHQFEMSGHGLSIDAKQKRAVEEKMDELYIAKAMLTDTKTGSLDRKGLANITKSSDYAGAVDIVKSSGFTFEGASTTDAEGGDFVPTGFSQTMLEDIYLALEIASLFKRFTMTASSFTFPFAIDRFTARLTAEKAANEKDTLATDQIIFTAKKLMAAIDFTDEISADAIPALLPYIRKRLVESFALAQDQVALNGATGDGLGGGVGVVTADDARRLQNGVRQLLNAGEKVDISAGGITAANLRALRLPMGKYGKNPSELAYILSMSDYLKCLNATNFPNYQALHTYGSNAQILTGELGRVDNIPLVITELIPTNLSAAGVYDVAGTKTTCGLVNKNAYMWGDLKQFGMETFRNPYNQFTSLIGSERLDFKKVLGSTAPTAAFGINY